MVDYQKKYLKYKQKYLDLTGGVPEHVDKKFSLLDIIKLFFVNDIQFIIDELSNWNLTIEYLINKTKIKYKIPLEKKLDYLICYDFEEIINEYKGIVFLAYPVDTFALYKNDIDNILDFFHFDKKIKLADILDKKLLKIPTEYNWNNETTIRTIIEATEKKMGKIMEKNKKYQLNNYIKIGKKLYNYIESNDYNKYAFARYSTDNHLEYYDMDTTLYKIFENENKS